MWDEIKRIPGCESVWPPGSYGEMWLLSVPPDETLAPSSWLIGQYKDLRNMATHLRNSETLQKFVTDCHARLGLRKTDQPPADVKQQKSFGPTAAGKGIGIDFTEQRVHALSDPVRPGPAPTNRRGDREENVRLFWATQTPHSHHIVEFNHLRKIGVSCEIGLDRMDHGQLPCVLLAPECHKCYITPILSRIDGLKEEELRKRLAQTYSDVYASPRAPLFRPLLDVSKIILRAAGILR